MSYRHETKINEQKVKPQKLRPRHSSKQKELQERSNERGGPVVNRYQFKRAAKALKKETGIRSCEAHELCAKILGYNSYNHYLAYN